MKKNAPPHLRKMRKFCGVRRRGVSFALHEDSFLGDLTTEAVVRGSPVITGKVVCQEPGILAGVEEAVWAFGKGCCTVKKKNGAILKDGTVVLTVRARPPVLRKIRTALNYLSRLSGVATNARRLRKRFGENRVAGLRKTTPGCGASEKLALQVGGVMAHRVNLGDGILIKKEHVTLVQKEVGGARAGAVYEATKRAVVFAKKNRVWVRGVFVGVEVENLAEALGAARARPDFLMLDNIPVVEAKKIVNEIKVLQPGLLIEASGGINEKQVASYLRVGVDVVSGSFVLDAKPLGFRFVLG